MQTLEIGQRLCGKGVHKVYVAHICPAQIRTLQCVMAQDTAGRQLLPAFQQHFGIQDALARKAAGAEGVHIELSAEAPVGIAAAGPGEDERKVRGPGAFEICLDARVNDRMSRNGKPVRTGDRHVQRVHCRADELPQRAGKDAGIRVEGDDVARTAQSVCVTRDRESAFLPAQELCQLRQCAALAFKAAVAFPVKTAPAKEKVKAAAVFLIECLDGL